MGIFSSFPLVLLPRIQASIIFMTLLLFLPKDMAQQNEFRNNTYDFPAKPRNQMEFGISGGMFTISGDVSAKVSNCWIFGAHVRKALGYIFSLRLQYILWKLLKEP